MSSIRPNLSLTSFVIAGLIQEFSSLPDASKLFFPSDLSPKAVSNLLPNLPISPSSSSSFPKSQLLNLLDDLLQLSPTKRPKASALLSHPYFAEQDILLPTGYVGMGGVTSSVTSDGVGTLREMLEGFIQSIPVPIVPPAS